MLKSNIDQLPGNYCESVVPDPILNSEVKPFSMMVLCLKTWKSRTLPGYYPYAYIYHRYCGFLGSNLAEFYLNKGFKVSGNDNLVGGELDNLDLNRINFYQIDCENLNELSKAMKGVDVVCHTAAYAHEGLSYSHQL